MTIKRDCFDVPHVFGKTEANVFYGVSWGVAEDRGLLMELARYPGRLACLDAPGFNAFAVALSGKQFKPSQQATTMRWSNRPTYQQILSFDGHRYLDRAHHFNL